MTAVPCIATSSAPLLLAMQSPTLDARSALPTPVIYASTSHAAMLTTTKTVLSAPLPRVFEESANGKAVPVATPAHGPIGGGFQQDELGRISKETVSHTQLALYPCLAVLGATPQHSSVTTVCHCCIWSGAIK